MSVREKGFTLIELLIVIALISILVSLAGPSYQVFIVDSRISGSVNAAQGLLSYARSEAVKAQDTVTVCGSNDSATCSGNVSWSNGWLVFVDRDADRTIDGDDQLLKVADAQQGGNTLRLTGINLATGVIQFNSRGELQGAAATAGTAVLCPADNDTLDARGVVVYLSGFTRLAVDEDNDGVVNDHAGNDVTCP